MMCFTIKGIRRLQKKYLNSLKTQTPADPKYSHKNTKRESLQHSLSAQESSSIFFFFFNAWNVGGKANL